MEARRSPQVAGGARRETLLIDSEQMILLPLWYAVFLMAITFHEAAHALVAYRFGDPTAYHGGQVSLNPLPHMAREPFGTVLVPLLTYVLMGWTMGWASAPYDPDWERRNPRRAAAMAAAGPLANLLLAAVAFAALKLGLANGLWLIPDAPRFDQLVTAAMPGGAAEGLGRLLSVMLGLNLLLFVFNLIPFPPLDGGAVASGLFDSARRFFDRMRASGMGNLIGLLLAWMIVRRLFLPVLSVAVSWLYR
jgi:Zn-dependent protease